jgi:hypothetical protein
VGPIAGLDAAERKISRPCRESNSYSDVARAVYSDDTGKKMFISREYIYGPLGSVVGYCNMLQSGRSRVRFPMRSPDSSIDLLLPAALWPCGRLSSL